MKHAFFLDRDGVINEEVNYLHRIEDVVILPHVEEAIHLIHQAGYLAVVISNQSGIARGMFTMTEVKAVENRIAELLHNDFPDAWYYCPHHPSKGTIPELVKDCDCRKPKPGLFFQAAKELNIDLASSFMIGDKLSDLQSGDAAGCSLSVLVTTGHGMEDEAQAKSESRIIQPDILEAVKYLLKGKIS